MRPHQKRYLIEALPAMGLYLVALFTIAWLAPHMDMDPVWRRVLIALSPLPAITWTAGALWRRLVRKDELEQRVELIAIATASAAVGIVSFAWGLLDRSNLAPHISVFYVLPALVGIYGLTKCVTWWRYR